MSNEQGPIHHEEGHKQEKPQKLILSDEIINHIMALTEQSLNYSERETLRLHLQGNSNREIQAIRQLSSEKSVALDKIKKKIGALEAVFPYYGIFALQYLSIDRRVLKAIEKKEIPSIKILGSVYVRNDDVTRFVEKLNQEGGQS